MREIIQQYGAVIISVIAAICFLAVAGIYFHMENGELKKKHTQYMDTMAMAQLPEMSGKIPWEAGEEEP